MADTGEDEEIELDTSPMTSPLRLWTPWRIGFFEAAPDTVVWFVHDGDRLQVPATDENHARAICDALLFVEYARCAAQPSWWRRWTRAWLLRTMAWINHGDRRSQDY